MTLIAGFHSAGKPALMGDFMLSRSNVFSGTRKKIRRISNNFAVAWTGSLVGANHVIKALQEALDPSRVTLDEVRAVLTNPELTNGLPEVVLIAWVVESTQQNCFRWRSDYPGEIFPGLPLFDGSGDARAEQLMPQGVFNTLVSDAARNLSATDGVLYVSSNLMRHEIVGPSTKDDCFGVAYEVLLWDDSSRRFSYVDDIFYFAMFVDFSDAGEPLNGKLHPVRYKVKSEGEFTVVMRIDFDKKRNEIHVIPPAGHDLSAEVEKLARRVKAEADVALPIKSTWYCAFLVMRSPSVTLPAATLVMNHGPQILTLKQNSFDVRFPANFFPTAFNAIRAEEERKRRLRAD
jgi:hypothetical protein